MQELALKLFLEQNKWISGASISKSAGGEPIVHIQIDVLPDMHCFKGHFPGNPILAGVTQLHWAVCVSRFIYGFDEVPGEVKRLKFKNIVTPPGLVELTLNKVSENEVQFEFASPGQIHSEGRLIFDGVAAC